MVGCVADFIAQPDEVRSGRALGPSVTCSGIWGANFGRRLLLLVEQRTSCSTFIARFVHSFGGRGGSDGESVLVSGDAISKMMGEQGNAIQEADLGRCSLLEICVIESSLTSCSLV